MKEKGIKVVNEKDKLYKAIKHLKKAKFLLFGTSKTRVNEPIVLREVQKYNALIKELYVDIRNMKDSKL